MALEEILHAIEEQSEKACASYRSAAEERVAAAMMRTKQEAAEIQKGLLSDAQDKSSEVRQKRISNTRRTIKKELCAIMANAQQKVFDEAGRALSEARCNERYRAFFTKAIQDAATVITGDLRIYIDPRDEDLAINIVSKMNSRISICPEIHCMGGIIAATKDGKVSIHNTLESRLEELKRRHYSEIARLIFPDIAAQGENNS